MAGEEGGAQAGRESGQGLFRQIQGFEVDEERDQEVGGADLLRLLPPRLADTGHAPTVEFAHVSSSPPEFALLAPDAIKLRSCADEQALLRDGDARSQVAVA